MSEGDRSESRWGDSYMYESDTSEPPDDTWDSQPLSIDDLDSDLFQHNDFQDTDNESSALAEFDWQNAVPGNGLDLQNISAKNLLHLGCNTFFLPCVEKILC